MNKHKTYTIAIIVILIFITVRVALPYIKVESHTYPATVVSKPEFNKIIVAYYYKTDSSEEVEVKVHDKNVWNLIVEGDTYSLTYNRKIFHKEYDLTYILPMDELPAPMEYTPE
jgi:hypothetical protein